MSPSSYTRVIFFRNFVELRVIMSGKKPMTLFTGIIEDIWVLCPGRNNLNPSLRNRRPSRITGSRIPTDEKTKSWRGKGTCPGLQSPERGVCQSSPAILPALSRETLSYLSFILHKTLCSVLGGSLWKIGKSSYSLTFLLAHSRARVSKFINIL